MVVMPGMIGSLFLIIIGAIAKFAYSDSVWTWTSGGHTHSLRVDTIGMILIFAGLIAFLLSVAYNFMARNDTLVEEKDVVVDDDPILPPKTISKRSRKNRRTGY